jgi:hypothetical protein
MAPAGVDRSLLAHGRCIVRQRERVSAQVWLKRLEHDTADGRIALASYDLASVNELMYYITHDYQRSVFVWEEGDYFKLQVLPKRLKNGQLSGPVAMAYVGTNLRKMLAAAHSDLGRLHKLSENWEGSAREHARFVA